MYIVWLKNLKIFLNINGNGLFQIWQSNYFIRVVYVHIYLLQNLHTRSKQHSWFLFTYIEMC